MSTCPRSHQHRYSDPDLTATAHQLLAHLTLPQQVRVGWGQWLSPRPGSLSLENLEDMSLEYGLGQTQQREWWVMRNGLPRGKLQGPGRQLWPSERACRSGLAASQAGGRLGLQREAAIKHTDLPRHGYGPCGYPSPSLRLRARAIIQDSQCGLLGAIYSKSHPSCLVAAFLCQRGVCPGRPPPVNLGSQAHLVSSEAP